jgi:hypothetical protein
MYWPIDGLNLLECYELKEIPSSIGNRQLCTSCIRFSVLN